MNTRMKFLEHELAEQEREQLRKAETKEQPFPVVSDNVAILERKIKELEALVNGLTEEMLDLKSVTRKLSMQIEKLGGTPVKSHPETLSRGVKKPEAEPNPAPHGRITPAPQPAAQPAAGRPIMRRPQPAAAPASAEAVPERRISSPVPQAAPAPVEEDVESLKAGEYEFVMQPDGTIQKRRKTRAQNVIIAGTGYGPGKTSRSSAIRADSHAVIEADEDDTVTLDR